MNDIINIIPEKYRGTALVLLALSPYITRALHALTTGGGLKGIFAAIWLGTNTPKASQSDSQGRLPLVILAGLMLSLAFVGCARLDPGARAVVVRAEQSITIANATFDSAVHIDQSNRDFFRTNAPAFHNYAEWLRNPIVMAPLTNSLPRGLAIVQSANAVKNAYKASNSTNDYALLISALASVETATVEAQKFIAETSTKK